MAKKGNKIRFSCVLSPELMEWIAVASERELRTQSNFVEFLLTKAMEQDKATNPTD